MLLQFTSDGTSPSKGSIPGPRSKQQWCLSYYLSKTKTNLNLKQLIDKKKIKRQKQCAAGNCNKYLLDLKNTTKKTPSKQVKSASYL